MGFQEPYSDIHNMTGKTPEFYFGGVTSSRHSLVYPTSQLTQCDPEEYLTEVDEYADFFAQGSIKYSAGIVDDRGQEVEVFTDLERTELDDSERLWDIGTYLLEGERDRLKEQLAGIEKRLYQSDFSGLGISFTNLE